MPTPSETEGEKGFSFPIEWVVPDDLEGEYATHVVVQHTGHEFNIFFFEAKQPLLAGSDEQKQEKLENISEIEAECVAKITVAASRFPSLVQVFQENLENFKQKYAPPKED